MCFSAMPLCVSHKVYLCRIIVYLLATYVSFLSYKIASDVCHACGLLNTCLDVYYVMLRYVA